MHCIIINPPPSIFKVLFYLIPEERLTPISEISKIIMTKLKTSLCLLFLTFFFLEVIHLDLVRQIAPYIQMITKVRNTPTVRTI